MEKKMNVIEKTFLFVFPFALISGFIIYLIWKNTDFLLSFILGTATSLLMNSLNYRVLKAAFKFNPASIRSKTVWMYIAKFLFFGLILFFTNMDNDWNIFFTLAGIMTYGAVLIPLTLYYAKRGESDRLD